MSSRSQPASFLIVVHVLVLACAAATVLAAAMARKPVPAPLASQAEGGANDHTPPEPSEATFGRVQRILTAACTFSGCHTGKHPKRDLSLDAGKAYDQLVGVPSGERPALKRVEPGSPDRSYLYLKITGDPSIDGRRMPRESPPLSDEEIHLIAQWIERGAPND